MAAAYAALASLSARWGASDYVGEPVSLARHAELAADLARRAAEGEGGAREGGGAAGEAMRRACDAAGPPSRAEWRDLVLASLLHDVGHAVGLEEGLPQMDGGIGTWEHERVGADFLRKLGFPPRVCLLVERHVDAKRYLCCRFPAYLNALSDASRATLTHQGGPMTPQEACAFETEEGGGLLRDVLRMRAFDEAAKDVDAKAPPFAFYKDAIISAVTSTLTKKQREAYARDGFLLLRECLTPAETEDLRTWVDELEGTEAVRGGLMAYYEGSEEDGTHKLCRHENFLPSHSGLRGFVSDAGGKLQRIASQLLDEEAVVFKVRRGARTHCSPPSAARRRVPSHKPAISRTHMQEKVNYKLAGGGGFPAHQDAPAFNAFGQQNHLTVSVAIDAATEANGCVVVAPGRHAEGLFEQDPVHRGLSEEAVASIDAAGVPAACAGSAASQLGLAQPLPPSGWVPVLMRPGDVLLFSSWLPHMSGRNITSAPRRNLYVTYNGASDGSFREMYYAEKRAKFPQRIERVPGVDYSEGARTYNLATPITG